jgi:DNA-binding NarL/FixJ family response regulator
VETLARIQAPAEAIELPFPDEEKGPKVSSPRKHRKQKSAYTPPPKKPPEKPGIKMQIAKMAIQGLPPSEIAARLGISLAEVDLALKLLNLPGKDRD